jgi:two-component system response regulator HydG
LGRELIGSELFGHERGAFTGAAHRKQGAFAAADQGTLFLDEIGELPLELQPQLLRVLETGEIRPLGSTHVEQVDVRIIAATNRRLEEHVAQGLFREDLLYRLHVLVIELPPLRERLLDLPELAQAFIAEFSPTGVHIELTPSALRKLLDHSWPGNVRELRHVLQRSILLRNSDVLGASDLSFTSITAKTAEPIPSNLSSLERHAIVQALGKSGGNKTDAALLLGISRSTLHRKLNEFQA